MRAGVRDVLLVTAGLAAAAGSAATPGGGAAAQSTDDAIRTARGGGTILLCRHASTDSFQEHEPVDYDDPSTQRQLDEQGEEQSRHIGAALARLDVPIGDLVASPMRRARRTAELMLGREPRIDTIWHTNGSDYSGPARDARRRALARPPQAGNTLIVSHIGTMASVVPEARDAVGEGDCVVLRPTGAGHEVIGIVPWEAWIEAARAARERLPSAPARANGPAAGGR